jgi:hypothetical protein
VARGAVSPPCGKKIPPYINTTLYKIYINILLGNPIVVLICLFQIHVGGKDYAHAYVFVPLPNNGDKPVLKGIQTKKGKDDDVNRDELMNSVNIKVDPIKIQTNPAKVDD